MRLLAISTVVLSGVLAAGAGVISQSLANARYRNNLEPFGMVIAGVAAGLFLIEWWSSRPSSQDK